MPSCFFKYSSQQLHPSCTYASFHIKSLVTLILSINLAPFQFLLYDLIQFKFECSSWLNLHIFIGYKGTGLTLVFIAALIELLSLISVFVIIFVLLMTFSFTLFLTSFVLILSVPSISRN